MNTKHLAHYLCGILLMVSSTLTAGGLAIDASQYQAGFGTSPQNGPNGQGGPILEAIFQDTAPNTVQMTATPENLFPNYSMTGLGVNVDNPGGVVSASIQSAPVGFNISQNTSGPNNTGGNYSFVFSATAIGWSNGNPLVVNFNGTGLTAVYFGQLETSNQFYLFANALNTNDFFTTSPYVATGVANIAAPEIPLYLLLGSFLGFVSLLKAIRLRERVAMQRIGRKGY
jgi:hypothetical protein